MSKKLKAKKPPLSALDNGIYACLTILPTFLALAGLWVLSDTFPSVFAFRDPSVIAISKEYMLFAYLPFMLVLALAPPFIFGFAWNRKQPIFGNKKFKPKWGEPIIKVHPVFSENFRRELTEAKRIKTKRTVMIFVTALLLGVIISLFGLFPRSTLDEHNIITDFNCFDQVTGTRRIEDANAVDICIFRSSGHRSSGRAYLAMKFIFEDGEFSFTLNDFRNMNTEQALRYMLSLKSLFSKEEYRIKRIHNMERLLNDHDYSPTEIALIYELFEYEN